MKRVTITEYQSLYNEKFLRTDKTRLGSNYKNLSDSDFRNLENFILDNRNKSSDNSEIMKISYRRGVGKLITAQNYVGVISLKNGTVIEILPKIYRNKAQKEDDAKKILLKMLGVVYNIPYKNFQTANMELKHCNIFEIFIKIFIDEVFAIAKRGLKSGYVTHQDNLNVFKGKIKFSEHIRYNHSHKERCFSEFDEFDIDRAENRLIKSTLIFLYGKTSSQKNKMNIHRLLNIFENVSESENYSYDFSRCNTDRNMKDYKNVMIWCRIFLNKKSFSVYSGTGAAFAMLFPMEKLFEEYVACLFKKELSSDEYNVIVQDNRHMLFDKLENNNSSDKNKMLFRLRPDIVVERKNSEGRHILIFDTKWKLLSNQEDKNYCIRSQDMYQMFAYHMRYPNVESVTLLYPKSDVDRLKYKADKVGNGLPFDVTVNVGFIDLTAENPLSSIINGSRCAAQVRADSVI